MGEYESPEAQKAIAQEIISKGEARLEKDNAILAALDEKEGV